MQNGQFENSPSIAIIETSVTLRFLEPTQAFGELHITFPDQNIVARQNPTGFERVLTSTNVGGSLIPRDSASNIPFSVTA